MSALLAWDYLENRHGWGAIELHPVNYHLRGRWSALPLEQPAAVVDFLYSSRAVFWADHHLSAFLDDDARRDFAAARDRVVLYDERADSCAGLLWRRLAADFGHRTERFAPLVRWAERIDAARYDSSREALFPQAAALRISASLALGEGDAYSEALVRALRSRSLEEVAGLREVSARFEEFTRLSQVGLERFERSARLEGDGIVVFDVDGDGAMVSRYAPFHYYPHAQYSAGITRWRRGAKITAMRNPWLEFDSVPLGKICETLGGGGHQRVGSIVLGEASGERPEAVLDRLLSEMRHLEAQASRGARHASTV